jgi:hypothetical protein
MALNQMKGLDQILKNLNKQIRSIDGDIYKGLILGMMRVKADSMSNTPVDTGNLKGSHYLVFGNGNVEQATSFNTSDKSGAKVASQHAGHVSDSLSNAKAKKAPFAEVGCTAFYAEIVHEDLEASHVKELYTKPKSFRGPVQPSFGNIGGAKFMEKAIRKNEGMILSLIKRFAKR